MGWGNFEYREYVPVAMRKANALKQATALAKTQGRALSPVTIEGRKIAKTFWGNAWCDNLKAYSDYANRLPRGATYVRNGSVIDLIVKPRRIEAIVAGSDVYHVTIEIAALKNETWQTIKRDASASIDSLLDLLAGRFSEGVMNRLTNQQGGLFPVPQEIKLNCSCPDSSYCCKHIAAVMYGVGARLDGQPELLFTLRNVDPQELVTKAVADGNLDKELVRDQGSLAGQDLGAIFGIELDVEPEKPKRRPRAASKKVVAEIVPSKSAAAKKSRKPSAKSSGAKTPVFAEESVAVQSPKQAKRRASTVKLIPANKPARSAKKSKADTTSATKSSTNRSRVSRPK